MKSILTVTIVVLTAIPVIAAPTVPPGYQVEVYASGFQNPNALAFSPGGTFGFMDQLFVADSRPSAGRIYRVPAKGSVLTFANARDNEPRSLAFGPAGSAYDGKVFSAQAYSIQQHDASGQRTQLISTSAFPWQIGFGPGGAWGTELYYADGAHQSLHRVSPTGVRTTVKQLGAYSNATYGFNGFAFGPGGAYGTDLYLVFGGGENQPASGRSSIRKMTPEGIVSTVAIDARFGSTNQITFDTGGLFGGMLYVSDSLAKTIWQISPTGVVSAFATGFNFTSGAYHINDGGDIVFGPDRAMYILDAGDKVVYRIIPEPATGVLALFAMGIAVSLRRTRHKS